MSALLTSDLARQAVDFVRPMIAHLMDSGITNRRFLHVVILDPAFPPHHDAPRILYEESLGDRAAWPRPFDRIARSKAEVVWRTGLSTHRVQQEAPYLFTVGDAKFRGGVNHLGIIVGVSGVQPQYDELIATAIAAACRALCTGPMEQILADADTLFIPE